MKTNSYSSENTKDSFRVEIISINEGLKVLKDARLVRIKSKDYNLLIMKDYVPIIGNIEGSFEVETPNENYKKENIIAYYVNTNNVFQILIKEKTHE